MLESVIASPEVVHYICKRFDIKMSKKLGQNFLIKRGIVDEIVHAAELTVGEPVLEVGPGIGTLTQGLAQSGADVTAIELDRRLLEVLDTTLASYDNVRIIHGDVLKLDVPTIMNHKPFKVVANLPYYITTPIIMSLLESKLPIERLVVMVQKEVADRLAAKPGSKIYGTPSVKLAWYGTAERVGTIGRNVFWPAPNVDSALVRFTRYQADDPAAPGTANSTDDGTQRELVFRLIDAAFGQRRKTLHAALKTIAPSEAFSIAGIDPTRRGETLTIAEFTALAKAIESCGDGDEAQ